jgi:hypothetical protein
MEKNEAILKKVRSKGVDGYKEFIKRLKIENQCKLADLLAYTEEGKDTSEIEQQLDVLVEETLSEYSKLKRSKYNLFYTDLFICQTTRCSREF